MPQDEYDVLQKMETNTCHIARKILPASTKLNAPASLKTSQHHVWTRTRHIPKPACPHAFAKYTIAFEQTSCTFTGPGLPCADFLSFSQSIRKVL
jgi:hypothetical protein